MPPLSAYLIIGAVAAATTFLLTPVMRRLAVRTGVVVEPHDRRVHESPTPTLGGVAMLAGVIAAFAVAATMSDFDTVLASSTEIWGLLIAAVIITAVGVIDDVREISAPAKLAGMVLAGSVLSFAGVALIVLRIPFFDTTLLSSDWSALLTVLWVLGIANAVNLIDGLDGLAGGIIAIAAGTFFLYALRLGEVDPPVIRADNAGALFAIVCMGVCIGFLPHNTHPARIFMGDGGALLLGLLMAASTMTVGGQNDAAFSGQAYFFFAPIFIPLFILGVPILDMVLAILRRATRRVSVATADKDHLHHRLMRLGHGHGRTVFIMWLWTALLSAFVLYPTYTGEGDAIVPAGIAALGLLLYTVFHPGIRRRPDVEPDPSDAEESSADV